MADPVVAIPGTELVITPCRHGNFLVPPKDMIGGLLVRYGEWAEQEINFLTRFLRPGDVVLDIGAHIGTFTMAFAHAVGTTGTVFSFEAQRLVFNLLCANIALNGLTTVFPCNAVVSAEDAQIRLRATPLAEHRNSGGFHLPSDAQSAPSPLATPKLRLDRHLAGLTGCRLIKLDIEGMEPFALAGLATTITRFKPIIYAEANTEARFAAVEAQLRQLGYRVFWHCPRHFNPDNFRGNPDNVFGDKADINVIAFPSQDHDIVPAGLVEAMDFADVAHLSPPS